MSPTLERIASMLAAKSVKGTPDSCWPWTGATRDGYGYFRVDLKAGSTIPAHRAAWILAFGPPPDDRCVCHTCDNRRCVNPGHLFLGTRLDNNRDRDEKGRSSRSPRGTYALTVDRPVSHARRRIGLETVQAILAQRARGVPVKEICSQHRLSESHVYKILKGNRWSARQLYGDPDERPRLPL